MNHDDHDDHDLLKESLELQERLDNPFRRTCMAGRSILMLDVGRRGAAQMYRENWDRCRDLWKENYRRMKLVRFHTDHPITPPDPERLEFERQYRERNQAEADRFNRAQQRRYEAWLKKRKAAE